MSRLRTARFAQVYKFYNWYEIKDKGVNYIIFIIYKIIINIIGMK